MTVLVEKHAGYRAIILNRPDRLNALTAEMGATLLAALDEAEHDPDCRAILITGAGRGFCAGQDLTEVTPTDAGPPDLKPLLDGYNAVIRKLHAIEMPVVCAVNGIAAGAGANLALACDIRIAAQSAFVSTGYLNVALSGDYGIAWLLTRLVGTARARELMFTAEKVSAERCERIGLVNRVVPDDKLQEEAFALAKSLANGPTLALRYMKDNLDEALQFDFATARDHEAMRLVRLTTTADHKEAVQAFIDKRKPVFKGN